MFNITAGVNENDTALRQMQQVLNELAQTQVLVGIPEDKAARKDGHISNAALMYIHSNGSPINGIPARPIIEPALEHDKERIGQIMGQATKAAFAGDTATMAQQLNRAGMEGQNAAKEWFTNPANNWPPVSPGRQEYKASRGTTVERPLIDTGKLQGSITYVVRKTGGG